jgi:hypothetical protein
MPVFVLILGYGCSLSVLDIICACLICFGTYGSLRTPRGFGILYRGCHVDASGGLLPDVTWFNLRPFGSMEKEKYQRSAR